MNYVIITPAYNEEDYIGETIDSVVGQTLKPERWIIVDDGSTDRTAEVISRYTLQYPWIQYVQRSRISGQSYYASNVYAILEGMKEIKESWPRMTFDYLAILDADVTLPADYYEKIGDAFAGDTRIGIVSGSCANKISDKFVKHLYDRRSCAKAIMVFRRKCFEEIGGFVPMKYGGEDTVACFAARMKGWKTWAYHELIVAHNKPLGTGPSRNILRIRFRQGIGEYCIAGHPLFVLVKCLRRCIMESPFVIGGGARLAGYVYAHFMGESREISSELARSAKYSITRSANRSCCT